MSLSSLIGSTFKNAKEGLCIAAEPVPRLVGKKHQNSSVGGTEAEDKEATELFTTQEPGNQITSIHPRKRKPRSKRKTDPVEKLERTLFVGNVPINLTEKTLKTTFQKCGTVSNLRFRSVPVQESKKPRKVSCMKNEYQEGRTSKIAYIVMETADMAKAAAETFQLEENSVLEGHHLRVRLASDKTIDHKRSIFVGNLSFDAEDEALRAHFDSCGEIEAVRIVRDPHSQLSKGFGFVLFKDATSVTAALSLNGSNFRERQLRVIPAAHPKKAAKLKAGKQAEISVAPSSTKPPRTSKQQGKRLRSSNFLRSATAVGKKHSRSSSAVPQDTASSKVDFSGFFEGLHAKEGSKPDITTKKRRVTTKQQSRPLPGKRLSQKKNK